MPRRSLKVNETELREERVTWLWNRRRSRRRDVAGQRRFNGSENRRWVHNGRVRRLLGCGGWRWTGDPGRLIGDVVEGEEGVSSESEVASRRAELFEKATTVFDPGRSSKTRFDNRESKLI
jgi:IS5 family transposase